MRSYCQLPARTAAVAVNTRSLLGSSRSAARRGDETPAVAPRCRYSFTAVPVHARVDLPHVEEGPLPLKVTAPPPVRPAPKPSTPTATEGCVKPIMVAVTSGQFLDGLTMDDYYPGLRAQGNFSNPSTAGPWDTGSRCGVNVQIVGGLNLLCRDELFQFTQTVHHDKSIINGTKDADDGTTHDDIAESRGDYTKPPRRQTRTTERDVGGNLLQVSMADPPSLLYSQVRSAEWDRTFVTALVGPRGKSETTWRVSTIVNDGKVVKNTVS